MTFSRARTFIGGILWPWTIHGSATRSVSFRPASPLSQPRRLAASDFGMTISSFNSLSLDPPLVLFSIWREANSFASWQRAERYAINVLSEYQEELSRNSRAPRARDGSGRRC